jgi:hypothetical protein
VAGPPQSNGKDGRYVVGGGEEGGKARGMSGGRGLVC